MLFAFIFKKAMFSWKKYVEDPNKEITLENIFTHITLILPQWLQHNLIIYAILSFIFLIIIINVIKNKYQITGN